MTPRPHITTVPMPVRAQQMAEARAKLYRAVPLPCEIVEEPADGWQDRETANGGGIA